MIRGVEFYFIVWFVVTAFIVFYNGLSRWERVNVMKAIWFGAKTAAVALILVVGLVILF